jgi:peptide/nickel transport system substrate-binding protein
VTQRPRSTPRRRRAAFLLAGVVLLAAGLLASAGPVGGAPDRTLRIGVLERLDSLNPYGTARVVGYEAFELTYQQMVGFGADLEPVPDFAASWERAEDKRSYTFTFRPDMQWSDGSPATSADACFSWQLALDAIAAESQIGWGYLEPGLEKAGVRKVDCPDPLTMIASTDDNSSRILQTYLPILPKHIWGTQTHETIGDDALFEPPADGSGLVGSGPYQAVEWNADEFVRFKRNPNYALNQGFEDEIVIRFFASNDEMVRALKAGGIDYARPISAEQFTALQREPDITPVNGASNGWTELAFNTYGTGTGKTIANGGPSTTALQDQAFRDALGFAIDKQRLIDSILGGFGTVGTTPVPPVLKAWHVDPTDVRAFDLELARRKLDTAGYTAGADGIRVDKNGKPLNLRLVMPDSDGSFAKAAQSIVEWFGQVGVKVTPKAYDESALIDLILPPEAGDAGKYKADYDLLIWTWSWGPDPSDPLQVFTCDQIGSSSDSMWCDIEYDDLYEQQLVAPDDAARHEILAQMQQLWYDAAPYHILYYDDALHAYRTDRFGGWQNQPSNGTPFFAYSVLGETLLTDATPTASPAASAAATAAASASQGATVTPPPTSSGTTGVDTRLVLAVLVLGGVLAVGAAAGVAVMRRRRRAAAVDPSHPSDPSDDPVS